MDAWFWIHLYILWRGLWLILGETLDRLLEGPRPERLVSLRMRMCSLRSVFKYVKLLRRHDASHRRAPRYPRLVVEGTYFPRDAFLSPTVTVHGDATDEDKARMVDIVRQYPLFHRALTEEEAVLAKFGTWMKIVALKAHFAHHAVFVQVAKLCRRRGAFFVATVSNDPFLEPSLTAIGLDTDMRQDVAAIAEAISNLKIISFQ